MLFCLFRKLAYVILERLFIYDWVIYNYIQLILKNGESLLGSSNFKSFKFPNQFL